MSENRSAEQKLVCVEKVWTNIWHPHRCGKPAKWLVDTGGPARSPLCGIHVRYWKRKDAKMEPAT